jgi:predicted MFS family arabinose efflux permease
MQTDRSRWLLLALLFVCRTSLGFQFQTLGSVSAQLVSHLGFNFTEIGTLIGLFMLPGMVLALPCGYAARFLSDRVLVSFGLLALGVGGGIAALAEGFGLIAAGRIVCGIGFVVSTIYFAKMVADWFVGKELATAMGILVMSWPFGIAMGQIGHEWLAATFDWRAAFLVSATYCMVGAALLFLMYRPPTRQSQSHSSPAISLPRPELVLTLIASLVWALFNAAYIIYLSFAPRVLIAEGYSPVQAAAVISLASWVMIVSGAVCGYIADRTGKPDLVLYLCTVVAMGSLLLLPHSSLAITLSFAFGLLGMAPAGVIMALTGEAMSPDHRAFGMGVFFSSYFIIVAPAPAIAGWLYDYSSNPYWSILFAVALFGMTALANLAFRATQKRLSSAFG